MYKYIKTMANVAPLQNEILVEICKSSSKTEVRSLVNQGYMRTCLMCLRPYISGLKHAAVAREDFETAEQAKRLIESVDSFIEYRDEDTKEKDGNN